MDTLLSVLIVVHRYLSVILSFRQLTVPHVPRMLSKEGLNGHAEA